MNHDTFDFSEALKLLKQGKKLTRLQFGTTCYVRMVNLDEEIQEGIHRLPYIEMVKRIKVFADSEPGSECLVTFPFVPSTESILDGDWYVVDENVFNLK